MPKSPPLIPDFADKRRLIPLAEVAKRTGIHWQTLRLAAIDGTIPGARQLAKGKRWYFERRELEKWWQDYNAPRPALIAK